MIDFRVWKVGFSGGSTNSSITVPLPSQESHFLDLGTMRYHQLFFQSYFHMIGLGIFECFSLP